MEAQKINRRSRVGRVVADKSMQTIKVELEGIIQHPKYKKYMKRSHTFLVHDPMEVAHLGDKVRIEECRPISKLKKWIVREVIEHANAKTADTGEVRTADAQTVKEASDDPARIDA